MSDGQDARWPDRQDACAILPVEPDSEQPFVLPPALG